MTGTRQTMALSDLVCAIYDASAQFGMEPKDTSRFATMAVTHILRRARTLQTEDPGAATGAGR